MDAPLLRYPVVRGTRGEVLCDVVDVFSLQCVHCQQTIYPNAHFPVYALAAPYFGLCHHNCLQYFSFNGEWPHPAPLRAYFTSESLNLRALDIAHASSLPPGGQ